MLTEVNDSLYSADKKSKLNIVLNVFIAIVFVVLIAEIMFAATYSGIYVVGTSMYPTLVGAESENTAGGDYVYVNKYAKPDYGDIVVVLRDKETTIIKRAVAFGGDYVKLEKGHLKIKYKGTDRFVTVEEDYVNEIKYPTSSKNNFYNDEEGYFVEEGYFFLLGDNRDVSEDSRARGAFKISHLYGVVVDWSMTHKSFISSAHKSLYFDIPRFLGLK